ncbi:MAG: single-stranded-DNA-specific exonuclease RecJ [Nitrospirae bacterium]|nr:single-stranded-DNA-specific exonuclease RecJ [Nitrospirota bacterium]
MSRSGASAKKWLVSRTNTEFVDYLSKSANVSPIIARILINRNIKTPDRVTDFIQSSITSMSDPMKISGMDVAVWKIAEAIKKGRRILVHGDYDADGTTATAIMVNVLGGLGALVEFFIPSRFNHGYGFHEKAVDLAKERGIGLIITVDCGISSFKAVDLAMEYGIEVIITDHHEPQWSEEQGGGSGVTPFKPILPDALCIINPKLDGIDSPLSILTGAGIALKLSQALTGSLDDIRDLLDIAALGTIADVAPLVGENRLIVKEGLCLLSSGNRPGIRALLKTAGLSNRPLCPDTLSYSIIPRINAAGRMDDASKVVNLLVTQSAEEAEEIAKTLDRLNSERQKVEEEVLVSALSRLNRRARDCADTDDNVIVIAGEDWHEGVLGIVASKIVDRFNVPAIVFSIKDGLARGSARSVQDIDICDTISSCSEHLIQFGGHKQAAGLKLRAENLTSFEKAIKTRVKDKFSGKDFTPTITIDADVYFKDINYKLINELSKLAPYGYGNPEPILGAKGLLALKPRVVGKNHLKFKLGFNGHVIDAIGYEMGDMVHELTSNARLDAIFTPTINAYNGTKSVQLNVKALRPSE